MNGVETRTRISIYYLIYKIGKPGSFARDRKVATERVLSHPRVVAWDTAARPQARADRLRFARGSQRAGGRRTFDISS